MAEVIDIDQEYEDGDKDSDDSEPSNKKPRITKKRADQRYKTEWERESDFNEWLRKGKVQTGQNSGYLAHCLYCKKDFVCKKGKHDAKRHKQTKAHEENKKAWITSSSKTMPLSLHFSGDSKIERVATVEAKLVTFLVEHDLPYSLSEDLLKLVKSMPGPDLLSQATLGRTKATNIARQALAPHFHEKLLENLKTNLFSVVIDETTDSSVAKQLAVCVSFCDEAMNVQVDLLALVECSDGSASGLFNQLVKVMDDVKKAGVPLQNWVGFCSDTTNAMMGINHSVKTLVEGKYPWVTVVKCSCHLCALVASHACKKLSKSLEDLCRTVCNHFRHSAKRQDAYRKEFQVFTQVEQHRFLALAPTRWLSFQNCARRILEQWDTLTLYWDSLVLDDPSHANDHVRMTLNNPYSRVMMFFVESLLGELNEFNTIFQSEKLLFHLMKTQVEKLLRTLAMNFMKPSYVRTVNPFDINPHDEVNYLPDENVYIGYKGYDFLVGLETKEVTSGRFEAESLRIRRSEGFLR